VRRFTLPGVSPGTDSVQSWDGLTTARRPAPDGAYRVLIEPAGGAQQEAGRLTLHGHMFPVRGRHGTRGPIGAFGAPRNGGRVHRGFDITGACGTPLAAVRAGAVIRRGFDPVLYGNFVLIKGIGEDRSYFYAHMVAPSSVTPHSNVQTGDIVGRIGRTGDATNTPCHLHFEIHVRGRPVNPEPQLRKWSRYS
jgi:peptidoglycan LD-endopeptidase LytH